MSRVLVPTLLALFAFASNSLLTREALGSHRIDAGTFTLIRLASGALLLAALVLARSKSWASLTGRSWIGPLALFAYAAPFSFAYLRIGAAAGALVLFGSVQLSLIGYALAKGERPSPAGWLGLFLAAFGLAWLTLPAASGHVDLSGSLLMAIAGIAWAIYTVAGKAAADPIAANARSFLWATPLAAVVALAGTSHATGRGILLAAISGAVTSGVGYAIWYRALPHLSVMQAAVAQLSVPVLAAAGAVAFLGEPLGPRLVSAGACVLLGVGLALWARQRR